MPVPTFDQFIEPLLRYLAAHSEGATAGDVHEALAEQLKLTAAERAEMLPSESQPVYKNRIGWAHDRLKRAGLSASPRRGFWKLTDAGFAYATKHRALPETEVERLARVDRSSRAKVATDASSILSPIVTIADNRSSPEERIETALAELRDSVARDLLEAIGRSPSEFFEQLVLDLLHAMEYGTNRSDLKRVGGSGDGGIDGISMVLSPSTALVSKGLRSSEALEEQRGQPGDPRIHGSAAASRRGEGRLHHDERVYEGRQRGGSEGSRKYRARRRRGALIADDGSRHRSEP